MPLRVQQYERARSPEFALDVAREIVSAKIANSAKVLSRSSRNHPETSLTNEVSQLNGMVKRIGRAGNLDSLRGVEGQAAAAYFKVFGRMLRTGLTFDKRTRRPPTDPVNALLSFGYTLLYHEAIAATAGVGFDPYLGFFHGVDYGRCSLALDLIEEFRAPVIDRLVVSIFNLNILAPKDFSSTEDGGTYLDDRGRKRFLEEYERLMASEFTNQATGQHTSFRQVLHDQALAMQRTVLQGIKYVPFQEWH